MDTKMSKGRRGLCTNYNNMWKSIEVYALITIICEKVLRSMHEVNKQWNMSHWLTNK